MFCVLTLLYVLGSRWSVQELTDVSVPVQKRRFGGVEPALSLVKNLLTVFTLIGNLIKLWQGRTSGP